VEPPTRRATDGKTEQTKEQAPGKHHEILDAQAPKAREAWIDVHADGGQCKSQRGLAALHCPCDNQWKGGRGLLSPMNISVV